jgi:LPS-assembly protein
MVIRADRMSYDHPDDLAVARGHVRISRDGNIYSGPELQLHVQRFEGFFLEPTYFFSRTGAGGSATRIDFIDDQRAVATGATYTSCPPDGSGGPAWAAEHQPREDGLRGQRGHRRRRGAALHGRAHPRRAGAELSADRRAQVRAGCRPTSTSTARAASVLEPYYWNIAPTATPPSRPA